MADTFGRFSALPIGPLLAARDGGLTLATTAAANGARCARSDFALGSGTVGVEFAVWGDDALAAVVGFVTPSASLSQALGSNANGIGWELATGRLLQGVGAVATGLPLVTHGDIVGLRVAFGSPSRLQLYLNGALVHQRDLLLSGPFDTNGRNKQVVVGFNRRHRRIKNARTAQGFVAGAGTNGGTINLYRQLDGQAETLWQQIPITGSVNIFNQPDGPDSADSIWNASLTLNDNANGATRRSYRAEVGSFTEQTVTHQSGSFDSQTITQSLSIVSIEQ